MKHKHHYYDEFDTGAPYPNETSENGNHAHYLYVRTGGGEGTRGTTNILTDDGTPQTSSLMGSGNNTSVDGLHTHNLSNHVHHCYTNNDTELCSDDNTGSTGSTETRPTNFTIKVWKRTA